MKRYFFCLVFGLFLLFPLPVWAVEGSTEAPEISASASILMDANSGRILYSEAMHQRRSIASITKIMTALVAVEASPDVGKSIEIPKDFPGAEGSSLYLEPGDRYTLETLLYGLLLHSGNDAALAIADYCAGDTETFVAWMNEKAQDLGMRNTHFANPNGLDAEGHYSTAYDMAILAREALKHPVIATMVGTKSIALEGRIFINHNKLLWRYESCVGLKTGYTDLAGRTLISAAERDGQTLIVVTLDDRNDWADHAALFDYGFANYPQRNVLENEDLFLPVEGSLKHFVKLKTQHSLQYPLGDEENWGLYYDIPESLSAPLKKGAIIGEVRLILEGDGVASTPILVGENITRDAVRGNYLIQDFFKKFVD